MRRRGQEIVAGLDLLLLALEVTNIGQRDGDRGREGGQEFDVV